MWNPFAKRALSGARSCRPGWGSALLACAITLAVGTPLAQAQQEYAPDNTEWNGLSELMALAEENHIEVDTPADLDLGALESTDAIVILFPGSALPPGLGGFMAEGGRVAIADDFGAAGDFLTSFGIRRQATSASGLRGNPNLPIAAPRGSHPITAGVSALVTNHPTTLHHPELVPVFSVGDPPEAVVLAGAVSSGRLIVLGDPSVLINNMMQFRGNKRFALNLLQYLTSNGGSGKVYLMLPEATLHGRFGTLNADRPLERTRLALTRATALDLPDVMVRMLAGAIAAILLLFAASALPGTSPYQRSIFLPSPPTKLGGTGGRLDQLRGSGDALPSALVYRMELLVELRRRLRLHPDTATPHVLRALTTAGLPPKLVAAGGSTLRRLDRLADQVDRPQRPPRLSRATLASMVEQGEALLRALPEPSTTTGPLGHSTPELAG
jgi:hypothetical protein